jgi:hypothetical protein
MFFKAEDGKQVQCEDGKFDGLQPAQLVWKEGMAGWERADKVFPEAFEKKSEPVVQDTTKPVVPQPEPAKPVEVSVEAKQAIQGQAQVLLNKMDDALPPNDIFEGADWRGYATCIDSWISGLQKKNQHVKITVIFVPDEKPRFKAMVS